MFGGSPGLTNGWQSGRLVYRMVGRWVVWVSGWLIAGYVSGGSNSLLDSWLEGCWSCWMDC